MKTAAKVLTIIGMVAGFWMIVPIVIGIFSLKKLEEAKSKDELMVWGILNLLFCSLLGGIFMLCLKDSDLNNANNAPTTSEF